MRITNMSKQSNASKKTTSYWLKGLGQLLIIAIVFIALSVFLSRNMLDTQQPAPLLTLNKHLSPLEPDGKNQRPIINKEHSTLVYFFAPWCTVCALSQPSLSAFANVRPEINIVMIALDWESSDQVKAFQQQHDFEHSILLGDDAIKQQWRVDAYPSYYFVDKNGNITSKDRGLVTLPGLITRAL